MHANKIMEVDASTCTGHSHCATPNNVDPGTVAGLFPIPERNLSKQTKLSLNSEPPRMHSDLSLKKEEKKREMHA